jgi:hypothetical protein
MHKFSVRQRGVQAMYVESMRSTTKLLLIAAYKTFSAYQKSILLLMNPTRNKEEMFHVV